MKYILAIVDKDTNTVTGFVGRYGMANTRKSALRFDRLGQCKNHAVNSVVVSRLLDGGLSLLTIMTIQR